MGGNTGSGNTESGGTMQRMHCLTEKGLVPLPADVDSILQ